MQYEVHRSLPIRGVRRQSRTSPCSHKHFLGWPASRTQGQRGARSWGTEREQARRGLGGLTAHH